MLRPTLRIPRRAGLFRPRSTPFPSVPPPSSSSSSSSSPFAFAAAPKLPQRRSIQTSPDPPRTLPQLDYGDEFAQNGVPGLYSAPGFNTAWTTYSKWCLDKLNERVAGEGFEGKTVKEIAIITSREAKSAAIFNYASMAHNNHFYFDTIAAHGGEDPREHMPRDLQKLLEASFGSLETLRDTLLGTANAMFGPGFVWLVRQRHTYARTADPFRILTTYQAGSPYPHAHWRRQGTDMNEVAGFSDRSGAVIRDYFNHMNRSNNRAPLHGAGPTPPDGGAAAAGGWYPEMNRPPGGADVVPVLCVNTWEHAWMPDYGVEGKADFLGRWWNVIHWGKVAERAFEVGGREMSAEPEMGQSRSADEAQI